MFAHFVQGQCHIIVHDRGIGIGLDRLLIVLHRNIPMTLLEVAYPLFIFYPRSRAREGDQGSIGCFSRLIRPVSGLARIASDGDAEDNEAESVGQRGTCHGILQIRWGTHKTRSCAMVLPQFSHKKMVKNSPSTSMSLRVGIRSRTV